MCVLRHAANLERLSEAVLGATGCSQGRLLWENIFPISTTTPPGARGKLEDMQHSNHLPNKQKEEPGTGCNGQPRKGRSCDSPDPFDFQIFERIFL